MIEKKLTEFYKNKQVLVTGGAGFIGSHIVDNLINLGAHVTVLDNLCTGNLKNLNQTIKKINFINGDITNFETCNNVCKNQNIIFHLAAFVSVPESMLNPIQCNKVNVYGTVNLLESSRLNNVNRFIFSSSSAVYGNKEGICKEDDICTPASEYGFSKFIGEQYCKKYYNLFGLKTVCLRYFNVHGPRQNPNGTYAAVVAKFINCMEQNKEIQIYGDGTQTRDFVPVEKVVNFNLIAGMHNKDEIFKKPINVASGKSINLVELIEHLKQYYPDYNKKISFLPARLGDVKHSKADCLILERIISELTNL